MDPQTVFCPTLDCPARGQAGQGNIHVHSVKERRYLCDVCHKTFAETKGTVFYRLQTDPAEVTRVVTLLAHGCPLQAIVVAFELDELNVVLSCAGKHLFLGTFRVAIVGKLMRQGTSDSIIATREMSFQDPGPVLVSAAIARNKPSASNTPRR